MGNAASVRPDLFVAMKNEYESKKNDMTDEELFSHMKNFHDKLEKAGPSAVAGALSGDN